MSEVSEGLRRPRRDWASVFDAWKSSGESQAEFCSRAGIPVASFAGALHRMRQSTPPGFVRVATPRSLSAVAIELPRGIRISASGLDVVDLVRRLTADN